MLNDFGFKIEVNVFVRSPQAVIVAGVVTHGNKDFPTAAVKVAHEKPVPTAIKPVQNKQINRNIQQPR